MALGCARGLSYILTGVKAEVRFEGADAKLTGSRRQGLHAGNRKKTLLFSTGQLRAHLVQGKSPSQADVLFTQGNGTGRTLYVVL